MKLIRNFMVLIGPISSIYDFLTFYVLLHFFPASQPEFHTGWFIESLATQTLVLFVIRTTGNPLKSRPSTPLAITTILMVIIGIVLPYSPLAGLLGLTALPGSFFIFLAISTVTYLLLVELAKQRLFGRTVTEVQIHPRDSRCETLVDQPSVRAGLHISSLPFSGTLLVTGITAEYLAE